MSNTISSPSAVRAAALIKALGETRTDILSVLYGLTEQDLTRPTVCPGWAVREQFGHIIDATEMLVRCLEGKEPGKFQPALMAPEMATKAVVRAQGFSIEQIKAEFNWAANNLLNLLESRDPGKWDEEIPHPYLGNCPAVMFAGIALLDWFIHPWDIRSALGQNPEPRPDHALLVATGLVGLLPRRLNLAQAEDLQGRFRYIIAKTDDPTQVLAQMDVVLADSKATIKRDISPEIIADLIFRGAAGEMALAMLGRKSPQKIIQPAPTNAEWLPHWGSLWISL